MEKPTLIKSNSKNVNRLKIKGLTKNKLNILKAGRLPLSVLLSFFSGRLGAIYFKEDNELIEDNDVIEEIDSEDSESEIIEEETIEEIDSEDSENETIEEETYDFEAPTHIEFSEEVNDDMDFAEAFKIARADVGAGGFFNWNGASYNTLYKTEWDALSDDEKEEYLHTIEEDSSFVDGTSVDHIEEDDIETIIDEISVDDVLDEDGNPVISHDNLIENLNDDVAIFEGEAEDLSDLYADETQKDDADDLYADEDDIDSGS